MFGYNQGSSSNIPGLHADGATPPGIVVDGAIVAGDGSGFGGGSVASFNAGVIAFGNGISSSPAVGEWGLDVSHRDNLGNVVAALHVDDAGNTVAAQGISEFGHSVPASAPTITGSRSAMGVGTYQIVEALAAKGTVIDGTAA